MKQLPSLLKKISSLRLLVVGDIMLDHYLWGDASRISPEAPVPIVNVSRATDTIGGAANVANNIAALGASVEVVGAIGRDSNGEKLLLRMREKGIAFDERWILKGARTITKTRVVVRNQQLCRLDHEDDPAVYRKALGDPSGMRLLESKLRKVDGVIFSDYAKGVLTSPVIKRIADLAKAQGKFVALDPKPSSGNAFFGMDLITPNRQEAIELSELKFLSESDVDLDRVCARISEKYGPRNLVVTLGADGMLIRNDRLVRKIDTAARQVYDVSGAGDTVIAALTLALTSGANLEVAAHFANAAAGVVVGKVGTATVTPEELIAYVKSS